MGTAKEYDDKHLGVPMTRPKRRLPNEKIIARYERGETVHDLAMAFSVDDRTIKRRLLAAGVTLRTWHEMLGRDLPVDEMVARYEAGESEKALSEAYSVSRPVIRRRLLKAGVAPRNRSQGMFARMARTTKEERMALSAAAHDASRGSTMPHSALVSRAKTIEATSEKFATPAEVLVAGWLRSAGLSVVHQKACDIYNIDLVVNERIAVELYGGNWHASGRHKAREQRRFKNLFDAGYSIIIVRYSTGTKRGLTPQCATKIGGLVARCASLPPEARKQFTIWGNGDDC